MLDALQSQPNEKLLWFLRHENDVIDRRAVLGRRVEAPIDCLITVKVKLSGSVFERTVRYFDITDEYLVLGDVSRLDKYGRQGDCIRSTSLRKFCFCRPEMVTPSPVKLK